MSQFWRGKRVLVTGGAGFLGRRVVERLEAFEPEAIIVPRKRDYDLRSDLQCGQLFSRTTPDVVLHLAAEVGGIGANGSHPAEFIYSNLKMGLVVMEYARQFGVQKYVTIGTVCSYPKFTPTPFREEDLWNGYPEETNAPYGLAKKMLLVQSQAYRQEHNFPGIYLLLANLYGPNDNDDLQNSHVIPAMIRKFTEAVELGKKAVVLWGTGKASREFLHVDDAARAILLAAEHYDGADPVNVGTGREITIQELAERIAEYTGFTGSIIWDHSKPDGQPRRALNTEKAQKYFGFKSEIPFEVGLKACVDTYRTQFV